MRQRHIKYLGTSPNHREIPVDPSLAGVVADTLMSRKKSSAEIKETLKKIGIELGPGKLKKVSLVYNPPKDSHSLYRLNLRMSVSVSYQLRNSVGYAKVRSM